MNEIKFKINLKTSGNLFRNKAEEEAQLKSRTTWLSTFLGAGMINLKNGDEFTLYGKKAILFKKMVEVNNIIDIDVVTKSETSPSDDGSSCELAYGMSYGVEKTISFSGQSVWVKWVQPTAENVSITLTENTSASLYYGNCDYLTPLESFEDTYSFEAVESVYYLEITDGEEGEISITVNEDSDEVYPLSEALFGNSTGNQLFRIDQETKEAYDSSHMDWIEDNYIESSSAIAGHNDKIYRIGIYSYPDEEESELYLEEIDVANETFGDWFLIQESIGPILSMAYISSLEKFLLITETASYHVSMSGELTLIKTFTEIDDDKYTALALMPSVTEEPDVLYGIKLGQLFMVNPSTGEPIEFNEETESIVLNVVGNPTVAGITGMCAHNGELIACFKITLENEEEESYDVNFLYSINKTNGECNVIGEYRDIDKVASVAFEEENVLYGATAISTFELFNSSIYRLYTNEEMETKEFILRFASNAEDNGTSQITYNYNDNCIYHISFRDFKVNSKPYDTNNKRFNLEKYNVLNGGIDQVELTGILNIPPSSIDDGGNDMYDGGNIISTNISAYVLYTHTQNTISGTYTPIQDGSVVDGTIWFGNGSTYFTNLYNGFFTLVAKDISIDKFEISGYLGADNNGSTSKESFSTTVNENQYTVYFKKVWGELSDPSVNHLIIVPGNGSGIEHTAAENTDSDNHAINNLQGANVDSIYYVVFASSTGRETSTPEAKAIADAYINLIEDTAENTLTSMNSGFNDVSSLIPERYDFTDESNVDDPDSIRGFTYDGENTFYFASNFGLFKIENGAVSILNNNPIYAHTSGLAYKEGMLYGVCDYHPFFLIIDPSTGEVTNEVEDKKFDSMFFPSEEGSIVNAKALLVRNGTLECVARTSLSEDSNVNDYITVNESNFEANLVALDVNLQEINSLAAFKSFIDFGGSYVYLYGDETKTEFIISKENCPIDLEIEGLIMQWNEAGYDTIGNPPSDGWQDLEINQITSNEEDWIVELNKPTSNYSIRMRYVGSPENSWVYGYWD